MNTPTRRTVLVSLSAASLLPACGRGEDSGAPADTPTRDPEPDPLSPDGTEDASLFPWGVQVGDATDSGAILSVETGATRLTLVVYQADETGWTEIDRQEGLAADEHLTIELTGLSADTAWTVVFYDEDSGGRSAPARFRTALGDLPDRVVVFGATSCLGGNQPWENLSRAAEERYDFFCLLGDTVYADGSSTESQYQWHWNQAMTTAGMRDLCASTSLIATWDDHEVDNNWSFASVSEEKFAAAVDRFDNALPHRAGQGTAGIWRKLTWGQTLEVFVLECRAERDAAEGIYLSREQLDWLKAELSASSARFKIILNSVPITDFFDAIGSLAEEDRWSGYPEQREEILAHTAGIEGVLWVSGDLHWSVVAYVDPVGGIAAEQHEVCAGPSGSFLNIAADLVVNREQYPIMFAEWNHTRFSCDPGTGIVSVAFIGDTGEILAEMDLQL